MDHRIVVDFIREPRKLYGRSEIEAAGFRLVRQEATPFLVENYMLHFEKR